MYRSLLLCLLFSLNSIAGPVTDYGQLQVQGNKIVSGNTGLPVQLKGYSTHGLQWFPLATGNGGTIENMVKDFDVQVVRLAMYVHERSGANGEVIAGYLGVNGDIYEDQVRPLILDAIANDIYVIVDWHIHWNTASEENKHHTPDPFTNEAKDFFTMVAAEFGTHPNIIYEVMNEPGTDISWQQVKAHAEPVYSEIRAVDADNLILVPTPNWSQNILAAANDPIEGSNIAYTMHFYAQSHNFRAEAAQALDQGIAIFATEWGMSDFTGDGAIDTSENGTSDLWVDWMRDNDISWSSWNFANKDESSSALKAYTSNNVENEQQWSQNAIKDGVAMQSGPWTDAVISESGKWLRSRIQEGQTCTANCSSVDIIQAENFSTMNGIETETTTDTDGGLNVGYIDPADWMTYSVNLPSTGSYTINYRVASEVGGSFQFEKAGGGVVYGAINVPNTGGWQNWQTISHTVNLTAGQQDVALASLSGAWNINWFEIVANGTIEDADNDGVADSADQCPNTPQATAVDANGCVIPVIHDADNDGVVDSADQCPNTPQGAAVDANGCTLPVENNCSGINTYPNWTANDWPGTPNTHNEPGDLMQVDGNAYSANWYTNSLPGSDASWSFVKSCN